MFLFKSFYRYFLQISDYLCYKISSKRDQNIVVLTFDDKIDKESIRIPRYLNNKNIKATFFIPPARTEDNLIKEIVSLGHEIGGHGYHHSQREARKNYAKSAFACYNHLKKFYPPLVSWRFPGLRGTKEGFKNVKNAGFKVDSSKSMFYPFQTPKKFRNMLECPFLRISLQSQMDTAVKKYEDLKRRIFNVISSRKGVFILPFHTSYQNKHFQKFKGLIKELNKRKIIFKQLRNVAKTRCKKLSPIATFTFVHR